MLYLHDPDALGELLPAEPSFRADQLREWLYDHPVLSTEEVTNLPAPLRERLAGDLWPFTVDVEQTGNHGRTVKWLFRAQDGVGIEAVLMGYTDRTTLCLSSQAGCALACSFLCHRPVRIRVERPKLPAGRVDVRTASVANGHVRSLRLQHFRERRHPLG